MKGMNEIYRINPAVFGFIVGITIDLVLLAIRS